MKKQQLFLRRLGLAVAAVMMVGFAGVRTAGAVACSTSPHVTSLDVTEGPIAGGTAVTITGTGFCNSHLRIFFGANKVGSPTFNSSTSISVTTPAGNAVGAVNVRVSQNTSAKPKQSTLTNAFIYTCASCQVSPVSLQYEGVDPTGQTTEPNGILEPGESAVGIKTTVINSAVPPVTETSVTGAVTNLTGPQNAASDIVYSMNDSAAAYGTITSGSTADCGSNCYAATVTIGGSGNRPTVNTTSDIDWDATMTEQPAVNGTNTTNTIAWRIHVGHTFSDVPTTSVFYTFLERLVHNHVTFGTGGGIFQPNGTVHRDAMAAFIARGFADGDANVPASGTIASADNPLINGSYNCTSGGTSLFSDVSPTSAFCKHIHYLAGLDVTQGDGSGHFNPSADVSRAIMSVFISRALVPGLGDDGVPDAFTGSGAFSGRTYDCTNGPSPFLDVPLGGTCKNIGYIWALGVVDGDGAGHFAPASAVTRIQMAKFLVNAFQLSAGSAQ